MVAHIVHWKLAGRTLAPLELNEVMHTLELGIVTAGFILMAVLVLATFVFGRFFCSWGCHILALEDASTWLLEKVGIRPKQVRSRALLLVPIGTMLYMFVWPQISRLIEGRSLPRLHIEGDGSAWSSFLTEDYARNLPGPGIAAVTLFVCGFVIVYALGSRTFCRYVCPYGAIFAIADRFAPGQIMKTGDCDACSLCTAACSSDIAVHKELRAYGTVVDSACLKDLDCVAVCPNGAIGYGFTRPSIFRKRKRSSALAKRYDYSWREELGLAVVFLPTLLVLRGLYDLLPFLLSLALAAIIAFLAVHAARLVSRKGVKFGKTQLKLSGRITRAGWVFTSVVVVVGLLLGHSALVRYHLFAGERAFAGLVGSASVLPAEIESTIGHLESAIGLAPVELPEVDRMLVDLHMMSAHPGGAEAALERILERDATDADARSRLVRILHGEGNATGADQQIEQMIAAAASSPNPAHALSSAYELRGVLLVERGDADGAFAAFERALEEHPQNAGASRSIGELYAGAGRFPEAIARFEESLKSDAESPMTHYNLAVVLGMVGEDERSIEHYVQAARLSPKDIDIRNNLGILYLRLGRFALAEEQLLEALALEPRFASAHFNLGRLRLAQHRRGEAEEHLRRAAALDGRFEAGMKELLFGSPPGLGGR